MSKIINNCYKQLFNYYYKNVNTQQKLIKRTFLSNAYYCQEVWNARLETPILQKVDLDDLFHELDNNYSKNNNISAIDVDIFANTVNSENHVDELLDVIHKLRLSADTSNSLPSTEHAVIRFLTNFGLYDRLLQILDDRLNYGVFLDSYTSSLLLDIFWKKNDYASGARIASQVMLQEDFNHPFVTYLSLLHCYKFLQKPEGWTEPPAPEEPEEEIKIRVKYIRNPFFDDHFDLKNPIQIVGKTVFMAGKTLNDSIGKTFQIVGLALQNKNEKALELLNKLKNETLVAEGLNLIPDGEIKTEALKLKVENINLQDLLENKCIEAERNLSEKDIADQCQKYEDWNNLRESALIEQQKRFEITERVKAIEKSQEKLKEKEKLLWYFDNQDKIELEIDSKKVFYPKRWFGKKKKPRKIDESYVPPDVKTVYSKET